MAGCASEIYIPDRGHIVLLNFHPGKGDETGKRRPALVLSSLAYNQTLGQAICIPISSKSKKRPAYVEITGLATDPSYAIPGLIRALDWRQRKAEFVSITDDATYREAILKLLPLIGAEKIFAQLC